MTQLSAPPPEPFSFPFRKWLESLVRLFNSHDHIPVGTIIAFAGGTVPYGYVLADGSAVSRETYSELFAQIGTIHGAGDGSTTFNLPDTRNRCIIGASTARPAGSTGGSWDHTHSIPAHYHAKGTGADLAVSINHDHASVTSSSASRHQHLVANNDVSSSSLSETKTLVRSYDGAGGAYAYDLKGGSNAADRGLTSLAGSHSHTVDIAAFTGNGSVSGRVGLVTGGVDGNAQMTSSSNNPPYLAETCLVKAFSGI